VLLATLLVLLGFLLRLLVDLLLLRRGGLAGQLGGELGLAVALVVLSGQRHQLGATRLVRAGSRIRGDEVTSLVEKECHLDTHSRVDLVATVVLVGEFEALGLEHCQLGGDVGATQHIEHAPLGVAGILQLHPPDLVGVDDHTFAAVPRFVAFDRDEECRAELLHDLVIRRDGVDHPVVDATGGQLRLLALVAQEVRCCIVLGLLEGGDALACREADEPQFRRHHGGDDEDRGGLRQGVRFGGFAFTATLFTSFVGDARLQLLGGLARRLLVAHDASIVPGLSLCHSLNAVGHFGLLGWFRLTLAVSLMTVWFWSPAKRVSRYERWW
jgi:hypothetical protein